MIPPNMFLKLIFRGFLIAVAKIKITPIDAAETNIAEENKGSSFLGT